MLTSTEICICTHILIFLLFSALFRKEYRNQKIEKWGIRNPDPIPHKVHTYLEYHSVCPLVQIGTPPPSTHCQSVPQANLSFPTEPKGGGGGVYTPQWVRGRGSPNSDDWRRSLALCLLCAIPPPPLPIYKEAFLRFSSMYKIRKPKQNLEIKVNHRFKVISSLYYKAERFAILSLYKLFLRYLKSLSSPENAEMQQCIIAKFTGCNLRMGVGGGGGGWGCQWQLAFMLSRGLIMNHESNTVNLLM
jgi:hypothetical protein